MPLYTAPEGRQVEILVSTEPTRDAAVSTGDSIENPAAQSHGAEAQLLEEINQGLSTAEWDRYHALIAKRQQESISDVELQELSSTSDRIETLNVHRLKTLVELARLRGTSLPSLLDQLGLATPPRVM